MGNKYLYNAFDNHTNTLTLEHVGTKVGAQRKAKQFAKDNGLDHYRVVDEKDLHIVDGMEVFKV